MKDPNPHTHYTADFSGMLSVCEVSRFEGAFVAGIGSAKAYGFGLLSLARV